MNSDKIVYYETVELPGIWKKIGFESSPREGESDDDAFKRIESKVKEWQSRPSPQRFEVVANETPIPIVNVNDQQIGTSMIEQINSCTELKTLESYKLIVRNNPEWNEAYRNKLIELSK